MRTNTASALLKKWEGLRLEPYQDSAGHWTIGYGHKILKTDPYAPYGPVAKITEAEADTLLARDMQIARETVLRVTRVPLSSSQLDALTSFVFNIGQTAFANSTLLSKLNAGDYAGAAGEFGRWIYAGGKEEGGLINRRTDEKSVFLS